MSRQDAYRAVQRNAMAAWESGADFLELLQIDPEVGRYLDRGKLSALFDLDYHLKHVETIFRRVLEPS
jgi:adenylosuccinate lyase